MCFWSERKVTNETALRDYLCAFAATQLRGIARGMGVDSPTTKSKGELIDEIVEIAAGRKQPAEDRPDFEAIRTIYNSIIR